MKDNENLIGLTCLAMLILIALFTLGYNVGQDGKEELEKKLCELKQYEYCTKKELLKTIK